MMKIAVLLALVGCAAAQDSSLGRGFGEFPWYNLADGLAEAKASGKPIMMVQHKSWCGMCKRFGPEFASTQGIKDRSEKFVMVNCHDDDPGCEASEYAPDGGYIPRILFLTPEGKHRSDIQAGNPKYKYFFAQGAAVSKAMDAALEPANEEL
eukprot:TRINITY_DN6563_c0_g1_i1.p1 TRINITY_DN6563_c0_g1~~TRINITY_DN6563_c0_g1_i1.p1  ORF type:complete len:152 (+),score=43.27 TRINITY_DN6563_c0_g1_i1:38-493(+)